MRLSLKKLLGELVGKCESDLVEQYKIEVGRSYALGECFLGPTVAGIYWEAIVKIRASLCVFRRLLPSSCLPACLLCVSASVLPSALVLTS